MKKSIIVNTKSRGRPKRPDGVDPVSAVRLPALITDQVDRWAEKREVSRSEAIRKLVELGLKVSRSRAPIGKKASAKASEMAGETIDRLGDPSATDDERASRKRRLLKGPKEFR